MNSNNNTDSDASNDSHNQEDQNDSIIEFDFLGSDNDPEINHTYHFNFFPTEDTIIHYFNLNSPVLVKKFKKHIDHDHPIAINFLTPEVSDDSQRDESTNNFLLQFCSLNQCFIISVPPKPKTAEFLKEVFRQYIFYGKGSQESLFNSLRNTVKNFRFFQYHNLDELNPTFQNQDLFSLFKLYIPNLQFQPTDQIQFSQSTGSCGGLAL